MSKFKWVVLFSVFFSVFLPANPGDKVKISDVVRLRTLFGLSPTFDERGGVRNIKVAVADSGFGTEEERAARLPVHTVVAQYKNDANEPIATEALGDSKHGLEMAQILCGIVGDDVTTHQRYPNLTLLNATNIQNLRYAVKYAIKNKIKVILHSNTNEFGGFGNGEGPYNKVVKEATDAGIIWINAAGNHGQKVYNGAVDLKFDREEKIYYAKFFDQKGSSKDYLEFTSLASQNIVNVVLIWDDFKDIGTQKDLNFTIEDSDGVAVPDITENAANAGKMVQVLSSTKIERNEPKVITPTEEMTVRLKKDEKYKIKITASHASFEKFGRRDKFRVILVPKGYGDTVKMPFASRGQQIVSPADFKDAIVVGIYSVISALGPTFSDPALWKPDVMLPRGAVAFDNGDSLSDSTSVAAAFMAGIVTNLLVFNPKAINQDFLDYFKTLPTLNKDRVRQIREEFETVPKQAKDAHPSIFATLKDLKIEPSHIGKNADGQYFIVLSELSSALSNRFIRFSNDIKFSDLNPGEFEFYLHQYSREQRNYMALFARPRGRLQGKIFLPPWSDPGMRAKFVQERSGSYKNYIEVVIDPRFNSEDAQFPEDAIKRKYVSPTKRQVEAFKGI